jgi:hypothetical protein
LSEGEEPLKCPKCAVVHVITSTDKKMYADVLGVEEIKERMKKRFDIVT